MRKAAGGVARVPPPGPPGGAPPIRWCSAPFTNCDQVLVAFRVLGSRKHEHWLNKVAVGLTARRGTKHGRMCHVELMMQTEPGLWYRFGIIKKSYVGSDEKGKPMFEWGTVHGKPVDQSSWDSKYIFLSLSVKRARQKEAFDFLQSQLQNKFNYYGYLFNIIMPGGIGAGEYHPRLHGQGAQWYCSQIVGCALQAMADEGKLADAPHLAVPQMHAWRAAGALASLMLGAALGALIGILAGRDTQLWHGLAPLAGVLAGLFGSMAAGSLLAALSSALSPRCQAYGGQANPRCVATMGRGWSGRGGSYKGLGMSSGRLPCLVCLRLFVRLVLTPQRQSRPRSDPLPPPPPVASRADWRAVVGTTRNFHQSSPNSLYDDLCTAKGVSRSRDPHGDTMCI